MIAAFLALTAATGAPATVTLGGAQITIPPPPGFRNVTTNPDAEWMARVYRSSTHDVAVFFVPEDLRVERVQTGRDVPRYMVVLRPRDPALQQPRSLREFRSDETVRKALARRGNLDVVRDADNAAITVAMSTAEGTDVVVATTSLLVRQRVLTFHVASIRSSDDDRRWVIETSLRWIDAITAAN